MKSGQVVKGSGQKAKGRKNPIRGSAQKVSGLTQINGWYYFRGPQVRNIRPIRVALDTRSFEEAVQLALNLRRSGENHFTAGTLGFEAQRFLLQRKAERISQWSMDSDGSALKLFGEFVGPDTLVSTITKAKIEEWRDYLSAEGKKVRKKGKDGEMRTLGKGSPLAPTSVKTYLLRIGTFFRWLRDEGGLIKNPMSEVAKPKAKKTRVDRFCQKAERDNLIATCDREDILALLMLGFHAGMRLNEIIQARPDWLRFWQMGDQWHGEIVVHQTDTFFPKDREARSIPMNSKLLVFLKNRKWEGRYLLHPEIEQGENKYRWNPRRPFGTLVERAGLKWVGVHTLRHTYATHLVMGGVPIASVARWLGDDVKTTFENYAGYVPNQAHIDAGL
jgi:integrase